MLKINTSAYGFDSVNPLYYSNKIEELRASFLSSIANEKYRIIQVFSDLEVQTEIYFNKVSQMTTGMVSMGNLTTILNQQSTNPKEIKSYFSRLMKLVDFESKEAFNLKKQLESIVDSCKDKEKKLISAFDIIKSEVDKNVQKVLQTLDENAVFKSPVFQWSEELKGHKVKINGVIAEQTNM